MKIKIPDLSGALNGLVSSLPELESRVPSLRTNWRKNGGMGGLVGRTLWDAWTARLANELSRREYRRILVLSGGGRGAAIVALRNPSAQVVAAVVTPSCVEPLAAEKSARGAQNMIIETFRAGRLPEEDDYFDCAVTTFSLWEAGDRRSTLRELCRVVRPGGAVYCLEETLSPALSMKRLAVKPLRRNAGGLITRKKLCRRMAEAGLREVASYGHAMDLAACCRGIK